MEQLPGEILRTVWDRMDEPTRKGICRLLGAAFARQHALPVEHLAVPRPDWGGFLAAQAERCVEHQRTQGLAEQWLVQIPSFLASVELPTRKGVLLHTEIMRDHVLVRQSGEEWVISGVFDYEPAFVGEAEYELASVGIFLSGGAPILFRAYLLGYGYAEAELTPDLRRRILAYALLHRYSNLKWYLDTVPPKLATNLDELATEWFAFA